MIFYNDPWWKKANRKELSYWPEQLFDLYLFVPPCRFVFDIVHRPHFARHFEFPLLVDYLHMRWLEAIKFQMKTSKKEIEIKIKMTRIVPYLFHSNSNTLKKCGIPENTVLFAILDQSACLWTLLVATLMGVSKISINTVLRKYIGLQHIQRSGS